MNLPWSNANAAPAQGLWLGPILVLVAVLLPTACVLWFMLAAVHNERLAIRQRLVEIYQEQIDEQPGRADEYWAGVRTAMQHVAGLPVPEAFAQLVRQGSVQSALIYRHGVLAYPLLELNTSPAPAPPEWTQAEALEAAGHPLQAATLYLRSAARQTNIDLRARALQSAARLFLRNGDRQAAVEIFAHELQRPEFENARDPMGNLITPNAALAGASLLDAGGREILVMGLEADLSRYSGPSMLSAQRIFLMEQLQLWKVPMDTLEAEKLALSAAERIAPGPLPPALRGETLRRLPGQDEVWAMTVFAPTLPDHSKPMADAVLGLWTQHDLESRLRADVVKVRGSGIDFSLLTKDWGDVPKDVLKIVPLGRYMPDWLLAVTWGAAGEHDPLSAAAGRQQWTYLWTGTLSIAAIALLGIAMAVHLRRQARLTALKNDLIATVSHELKTPLSSMRVLVDTLLAGRCKTPEQEKEYLGLIARENTRLSRLIDNFLTFSRMERNKRSFNFATVDVNQVVRDAVEALGDRGRQIQMETTPDLPPVQADHDALVTMTLNLLDNACKYSPDSTPIRVRTYSGSGGQDVAIAVQDQGTGIARRHQSRIFERFFQVDQTLARQAGGCGLGLCIVRFILDAHGGTIVVESELGRGSTFIVRLPLRMDY